MADQPQTSALSIARTERAFFSRLSTGMKMLLILSVALLPLGMIAVFASRESAHVNRLRHEAEARATATAGASAISDALTPGSLGLRQAMNDLVSSITEYPINQEQCRLRLAAAAARNKAIGGLAMFDRDGKLICRTEKFVRVPAYYPSSDVGYEVRLAAVQAMVLTTIAASRGGYFGVAEFPTGTMVGLLPKLHDVKPGVSLLQGSQAITLQTEQTSNPLDQIVRVVVPVAGGQLGLEMRMPATPVSTVDVLLILLPILMWAAGGVIGWLVIDRLLLRPLGQMQRAIASFTRGEGPLSLPRLTTPAREIRELGESFQRATETLTAHENELAEGLANQKRLTREVHHRVKNNLQVVSSLINLHSRGAVSQPVAEAYASIQRRVDALAVVHRNHYAELEEHQGVSLRALIGEIASNLRASATHAAAHTTITLSVTTSSATQDVAVPVAFLITEIVELVMICGPDTNITISLTSIADKPERALLSITAPSLASQDCLDGPTAQRFQRIAGGLARQLRSPLHHDVADGHYAIEIPILRA
jgi:two-component system, sensor histidine kinase PdtaS